MLGRAAAMALILALVVTRPVTAGEHVAQERTSEAAIASSLKTAIRQSDQLSLFTKLSIKHRFDKVTTAAKRFKRGEMPEYNLKVVFETAITWLEGVVAEDDPKLHLQLVEARPVLWRLALKR